MIKEIALQHPVERGAVTCFNQVMDEENGWRPDFPDEVLSTILAFLPLISILRCRLVGKRWNTLSQGFVFSKTYARVSGELCRHYIHLLEKSRDFAGAQVLSSVGGLLLVTTLEEPNDQLYVVNPMIATLKRIPKMLPCSGSNKHDFSVVGMVFNSSTNVYKILAAQESARPVRLQIYNSNLESWQWAGTWTVGQPWTRRESTSNLLCSNLCTKVHKQCVAVNPISFHVLHMALHEGNLYCLTVAATCHFHVLRFDPSCNAWLEVAGHFPPSSSGFVCDFRCRPILFENGGRLMIAAAQITWPTSIRVTVWQYGVEDAEWKQVACDPQQVEEEDVCGGPYADDSFFYLDAGGDHLCLGAFPSLRNEDPKVFVYNIHDSWLLCRLPEEEEKKKVVYWQKRAFLYQPTSLYHQHEVNT